MSLVRIEAYATALIPCMYPYGVFVSQDWDGNVKLVFKLWPMSILVMMDYVWNMIIHVEHIEFLFLHECIVLTHLFHIV